MKKSTITITYDEERLNAIQVHLALKSLDLNTEMSGVLDTLYNKYVPFSVRNYIELRDVAAPSSPAKKPVGAGKEQTNGDDMDVTLWFNKHRLDALYDHDVDIENDLTAYFNSLYDQFVPANERKQIEARIKTEQEESDRATEQSRRFALLTVVQDGESACYEYDNCPHVLTAAQWFVRALKENPRTPCDDGVRTILPEMTDSVQQIQTDPRVTLCAELNQDKGYMRVWEDGGWVEYGGDQLTKAVRAATRKQYLTPDQREEIFETKLDELAAVTSESDENEDADMGMRMQ